MSIAYKPNIIQNSDRENEYTQGSQGSKTIKWLPSVWRLSTGGKTEQKKPESDLFKFFIFLKVRLVFPLKEKDKITIGEYMSHFWGSGNAYFLILLGYVLWKISEPTTFGFMDSLVGIFFIIQNPSTHTHAWHDTHTERRTPHPPHTSWVKKLESHLFPSFFYLFSREE